MDMIDAIIDIESGDVTQERYIECYQYLIDSGVVWGLQGSHVRTAQWLIENGHCYDSQTVTSMIEGYYHD